MMFPASVATHFSTPNTRVVGCVRWWKLLLEVVAGGGSSEWVSGGWMGGGLWWRLVLWVAGCGGGWCCGVASVGGVSVGGW